MTTKTISQPLTQTQPEDPRMADGADYTEWTRCQTTRNKFNSHSTK